MALSAKVEDDRSDCRDFIAIFSYGDLGEGEVMKCIADNNGIRGDADDRGATEENT